VSSGSTSQGNSGGCTVTDTGRAPLAPALALGFGAALALVRRRRR
jgi:MYXO-CTERM domain-containing protein